MLEHEQWPAVIRGVKGDMMYTPPAFITASFLPHSPKRPDNFLFSNISLPGLTSRWYLPRDFKESSPCLDVKPAVPPLFVVFIQHVSSLAHTVAPHLALRRSSKKTNLTSTTAYSCGDIFEPRHTSNHAFTPGCLECILRR